MVIKEIHIDGFGVFSNFSLQLPGKGVHIILGNNEAGKSTLLKFIRHILFKSKSNLVAPLRGGSPGGRIKILHSSGQEALFEKDDKKFMLHLNGSAVLHDTQWSDYVGHATESLFNNVYAFTLDELIDIKSLNDSGMADKIFSLGMGLGKLSISEIEKNILEHVNRIARLSRRGQSEIADLRSQIKETTLQIQGIQNNLQLYRNLEQDITLLERDITGVAEHTRVLRQEYQSLDACLRCYESFISFKMAEEELQMLPPRQDFPEHGIRNLENLRLTQKRLEDEINQLNNGGDTERGIADTEMTLENLQINRSLLQQHEMAEEIRLKQAKYEDVASELENERQHLKAQSEQISQIISGQISSAWSEYDVLNFRDEAVHMGRIDQLSAALQQVTDEKKNWEAQEKALMAGGHGYDLPGIALVIAGVLAVIALPFLYVSSYIWGATFMVVALVLLLGRKMFRREDKITPVKTRIKELEDEQRNILTGYRSWLKNELKLPDTLSFQALSRIIQTIGHVRQLIGHRDTLKTKIQENLLPKVLDFESRARNLRQYLQSPPAHDDMKLLVAAILSEYDDAADQLAEMQALTADLVQKRKKMKQLQDELEVCINSSSKLLQDTGAQTDEEFIRKYKENDRVIHLQLQRKNALATMETVAGYNKSEDVIRFLTDNEKQVIETRITELAQQIQAEDNRLAMLNTTLGSKQAEKQRIAGESELSEKLTELETLRNRFSIAAKNWLSGLIALKVLQTVRQGYEKDKQPAVIRYSSGHFARITDGKYSGIRTGIDDKEIRIFDQRESSLRISELSRGTREQLLISLRLGFIEEYEKNTEPLPLVVDEILVNSDPVRALQTAGILEKFAENRQLLLFTCHPSTADLFTNPFVTRVNEGELCD
jgi:uncharacterized protein YhaN